MISFLFPLFCHGVTQTVVPAGCQSWKVALHSQTTLLPNNTKVIETVAKGL
jgi:hypothetical protein